MSARDVIVARVFEQWRLRMSPQEADAILSALRAAGYAVVPREPTNKMCAAGGPEVRKACGLDSGNGDMHTIWNAMIAAAEPPDA